MLRSFRVANHRSFHAEQELVLLPAYDKSRETVTVAGIFGANASGKSNLLDALAFMQSAVRTSFGGWEAGSGVPRTRFRLDGATAQEPSTFVVDVTLDGIQYTYGFAATSLAITEEWLYAYPHRRKRVIFERGDGVIAFGSTVADYRAKSDFLTELTRDNALVLSAAAQANQETVGRIYEWFRVGLRLLRRPAGTRIDSLRVASALEAYPALTDLMRAADLGIEDIHITRGDMPEDKARAELARLESRLDGLGATPSSADAVALYEQFRKLRSAFANGSEVLFLHGETRLPLGISDQSDGTLAWLGLLLEAIEVLRDGSALFVDEIDSSLHPHLTARLVGLFQDSETNPRSAQLVFTTHDATLLSPALGDDPLRRDEIWFVEKDSAGASRLFPLSDFHPRTGENAAKRYLAGAYGAIPSTSEFEFRSAGLELAGSRG